MIKASNGALGLEIVPKGEVVHFVGCFNEEIKSEIIMNRTDAKKLIHTGTYEIHGGRGGLISHMPQGVNLFFRPNKNHDLVCVESQDFVNELEKILKT